MKNHNLIACALMLPVLLTSPARAAEPIKFGFGMPLSGSLASYGEDIKAGIDIAIADINAKGGILGRTLEPIYSDNACDPKNAVAVANRFVTMNVDAVTDVCSTACLAEAPIYAEEGIPFLTQCSTEQITAKGWQNIFRTIPGNAQESPRLAALVIRLSASKKLALVHDDQEYNVNLVKNITPALTTAKIEPAVYSVVGDVNDYSSYITKLKDQKVEVVYVGLFPKGMGLFLRQAAEAGYHPQFIGPFTATTSDVENIAGTAAMEGMVITNIPDPKNVLAAQPIIKALAQKGVIDRPFAVYGYVLMEIYKDAVETARGTDKAAVIKALKSTALPTIMGPVTFTNNGDMNGIDFDYDQWHDGHWVPFTPH